MRPGQRVFMGISQSGRPDPIPALPQSVPHCACPGPGGSGLHLLLVQGQVQERPPAQRLHVPRLGPQHGVEVEQGGLLLAQERVASGAGEQGLAGLAPWRKGCGIRATHWPQRVTGWQQAGTVPLSSSSLYGTPPGARCGED